MRAVPDVAEAAALRAVEWERRSRIACVSFPPERSFLSWALDWNFHCSLDRAAVVASMRWRLLLLLGSFTALALDSVNLRTAATNSQAAASPPSTTFGMLANELSERREQSAVMNSSFSANTLNTCRISDRRDSNDGVSFPSSLGRWMDSDLEMLESEVRASEGDEALTKRSICWSISTSDIFRRTYGSMSIGFQNAFASQ